MTKSLVLEKITQLSSLPKRRRNEAFRATLGLISTVLTSFVALLSVGFMVVENYHPEDLKGTNVFYLGTFFFLLIFYVVLTLLPAILGKQVMSGVTIIVLATGIGITTYLSFSLKNKTLTTAAFLVVLGIVLSWIAELATSIGLLFVYAYWKRTGVLITIGIFEAAIAFFIHITVISKVSPFETVLLALGMNVILFSALVITYRTTREDPLFDWFNEKALSFSVLGGISFCDLDLTNCRFDQLDLNHVDFSNATIRRTSFRGARNLDYARCEGTILSNRKVRRLLSLPLDQEVVDKDFIDVDLSGADLQGMNLEGANFTGANLTHANLSGAVLNDAIFSQARLFHANLRGAALNGIRIHDWGINQATCFEDVDCGWVYLKQGKYAPLERKPDVDQFRLGEFEKWIRQLQDTIDLILREPPNVRALAAAIKEASQALGGVDPSRFSIESKGDDLYVAKIGTTPDADKIQLAQNIVVNYTAINELTMQGEGNRLLLSPQGEYTEGNTQNISAGENVDLSSESNISVGGDVMDSSLTMGDRNS